jgi:PAS domain S-box-containing protein
MQSSSVFLNTVRQRVTTGQRLPAWLKYLLAAAMTTGALGITALLPYHHSRPLFILFTFAIAASAWIGGLRVGFFAWLLSLVELLGLLIVSHGSLTAAAQSGELFRLANNVTVSAVGVWIVARFRGAVRHLQEVLTRERKGRTELRHIEKALRYQLELTQAITHSAADSIFATDAEGCVTFVNPEAEKTFGLSGKELLGKRLHDVIHHHHPDGRPFPAAECKLAALHRRDESVRSFDDVFFRRDGSPVEVSYSNAPIVMGGRRVGTVLVVRNITERKQTEGVLLRSEKMALAGRVAATVAHEINNPLAAVMNLLFIARSSGALEEVRQCLDTADAELRRISHISLRGLGFYRESAVPAATSVGAILDAAIDLLITKSKANYVSIERQYGHGPEVMAVNGELRQVFCNLIANSLDAVDRYGTIKLRVSTYRRKDTGADSVRVTIADNGSGMSGTVLPRVFEPFYTTKGSAGTGLGLWVTRQFVEKYAGTIRVRSSCCGARRGTTVSVILPAATHASQVTSDTTRTRTASAS